MTASTSTSGWASAADSTNTQRWIRRFAPRPDAGTLLVFLPHAGGSASYYLPVVRQLDPSIEALAIQYPGRQERRGEPCIDDIHELADQVAAALLPDLDRPFALFGHSMGAMVGFEIATRLEAIGRGPLALFASARRPPSMPRDDGVHRMSDGQLIAQIAALSGTDPMVLADDELLRSVLPAIRSDYRAAETYRARPGVRLSCPLSALIGQTDPQVSAAEAQGWADHTGGPFELHTFPGGHFYLNEHVPAVLQLIARKLAAVR